MVVFLSGEQSCGRDILAMYQGVGRVAQLIFVNFPHMKGQEMSTRHIKLLQARTDQSKMTLIARLRDCEV